MTQVTPENIKDFFEQAAKAYGDAWKVQADYYEGLVRRNAQAMTDLADARVASFNEMRESKTFNQAFEANLAFEEKVREGLVALQEENTKSWENLVEELKGIYTPAKKAAKAPAKKASAKKARNLFVPRDTECANAHWLCGYFRPIDRAGRHRSLQTHYPDR
jgi:hypothetical protein